MGTVPDILGMGLAQLQAQIRLEIKNARPGPFKVFGALSAQLNFEIHGRNYIVGSFSGHPDTAFCNWLGTLEVSWA